MGGLNGTGHCSTPFKGVVFYRVRLLARPHVFNWYSHRRLSHAVREKKFRRAISKKPDIPLENLTFHFHIFFRKFVRFETCFGQFITNKLVLQNGFIMQYRMVFLRLKTISRQKWLFFLSYFCLFLL